MKVETVVKVNIDDFICSIKNEDDALKIVKRIDKAIMDCGFTQAIAKYAIKAQKKELDPTHEYLKELKGMLK